MITGRVCLYQFQKIIVRGARRTLYTKYRDDEATKHNYFLELVLLGDYRLRVSALIRGVRDRPIVASHIALFKIKFSLWARFVLWKWSVHGKAICQVGGWMRIGSIFNSKTTWAAIGIARCATNRSSCNVSAKNQNPSIGSHTPFVSE